MGLLKRFLDIRYFFKWFAQWSGNLYNTWFVPYHVDEEDAEEETSGSTGGDATSSSEPATTSTNKGSAPDDLSPYDIPETSDSLTEILAFRGARTQKGLAAIVGEDSDQVGRELEALVDSAVVERLSEGRYLLVDDERSRILRANPDAANWFSRLQHAELENDTIEVLTEICRQLPAKITAGDNLVFHLRQRKWLIWKSREETCQVRVYGTMSREANKRVSRTLDKRGRRFRRKEPHEWDARDWVSFRWRIGADREEISAILLESGRQFIRHQRQRRGRGRRRSSGGRAGGSVKQ